MRFRLLLVALCLPVSLTAQATVTVSLQDPVYRDLDRLFDAGLVKTMIVDQRPYSRREVARIILDAIANPLRQPVSDANGRLIARLQREYATDIGLLRGDTLSRKVQLNVAHADLLGTNSLPRPIPPDPLGEVQADIDPLLNGRSGRTYRVGTNAALE